MAFGGGGGTSAIGTSSDVYLSTKAQNDILVYNSQTVKWNNKPLVGTAALANGGGVESIFTNTTATGSVTLNLADGNVFVITLTGATTVAFSGATAGKACSFTLYLKQDATGGRTVSWGTMTVKWSGGQPTLSTAANAVDILVFETLDGGAIWYGSLVGTNFV